MKVLTMLMIIFLGVTGIMYGQTLPTDPETNKVTISETVTLDGVSKDDLYERSKVWLTHRNKSNIFDKKDKEKGEIIQESSFIVTLSYDHKYKEENVVKFYITINQKDGKYRYIFSDFSVYKSATGEKSAQALEAYFPKLRQNNKNEFVAQFTAEIQKITDDLKNTIKEGKIPNVDEW